MLSLHKFYFDAIVRARNTGERYGQAMFNHLYEVRPDLAEQVRSQPTDPFYVEKLNHPAWDRFVYFIEKNWFGGKAEDGGRDLQDNEKWQR